MRVIYHVTLYIGILFFIGCGGNGQTDEIPDVGLTTETITLETIRCQMCATSVQRAAGGVDGVAGMRVDLDGRTSVVSFDAERTSLAEIEAAIARVGYHANNTLRDEEAYADLPDCCR
jgi:periplasmic mercuric ion binding protein